MREAFTFSASQPFRLLSATIPPPTPAGRVPRNFRGISNHGVPPPPSQAKGLA